MRARSSSACRSTPLAVWTQSRAALGGLDAVLTPWTCVQDPSSRPGPQATQAVSAESVCVLRYACSPLDHVTI